MSKRELLFSLDKKDFILQTFRCGGKGGQHQNKTNSGVRIIHKASKAVGESREFKSQVQNKKTAFNRLIQTEKFKMWHSQKCWEMMHDKEKKSVNEIIQELLSSSNLKIEVREENKWSTTSKL